MPLGAREGLCDAFLDWHACLLHDQLKVLMRRTMDQVRLPALHGFSSLNDTGQLVGTIGILDAEDGLKPLGGFIKVLAIKWVQVFVELAYRGRESFVPILLLISPCQRYDRFNNIATLSSVLLSLGSLSNLIFHLLRLVFIGRVLILLKGCWLGACLIFLRW